ncbi:hypothetical protein B484DRAFT_449811 [Ochromonadaceae sp. CCMP2298]|nr:hypothetical protein B484DRAFT_449811 [Ochromonadaceae sp. CCMP2298]
MDILDEFQHNANLLAGAGVGRGQIKQAEAYFCSLRARQPEAAFQVSLHLLWQATHAPASASVSPAAELVAAQTLCWVCRHRVLGTQQLEALLGMLTAILGPGGAGETGGTGGTGDACRRVPPRPVVAQLAIALAACLLTLTFSAQAQEREGQAHGLEHGGGWLARILHKLLGINVHPLGEDISASLPYDFLLAVACALPETASAKEVRVLLVEHMPGDDVDAWLLGETPTLIALLSVCTKEHGRGNTVLAWGCARAWIEDTAALLHSSVRPPRSYLAAQSKKQTQMQMQIQTQEQTHLQMQAQQQMEAQVQRRRTLGLRCLGAWVESGALACALEVMTVSVQAVSPGTAEALEASLDLVCVLCASASAPASVSASSRPSGSHSAYNNLYEGGTGGETDLALSALSASLVCRLLPMLGAMLGSAGQQMMEACGALVQTQAQIQSVGDYALRAYAERALLVLRSAAECASPLLRTSWVCIAQERGEEGCEGDAVAVWAAFLRTVGNFLHTQSEACACCIEQLLQPPQPQHAPKAHTYQVPPRSAGLVVFLREYAMQAVQTATPLLLLLAELAYADVPADPRAALVAAADIALEALLVSAVKAGILLERPWILGSAQTVQEEEDFEEYRLNVRDTLRSLASSVPSIVVWLLQHTNDAVVQYAVRVATIATAVTAEGRGALEELGAQGLQGAGTVCVEWGGGWALLEGLMHALTAVSKLFFRAEGGNGDSTLREMHRLLLLLTSTDVCAVDASPVDTSAGAGGRPPSLRLRDVSAICLDCRPAARMAVVLISDMLPLFLQRLVRRCAHCPHSVWEVLGVPSGFPGNSGHPLSPDNGGSQGLGQGWGQGSVPHLRRLYADALSALVLTLRHPEEPFSLLQAEGAFTGAGNDACPPALALSLHVQGCLTPFRVNQDHIGAVSLHRLMTALHQPCAREGQEQELMRQILHDCILDGPSVDWDAAENMDGNAHGYGYGGCECSEVADLPPLGLLLSSVATDLKAVSASYHAGVGAGADTRQMDVYGEASAVHRIVCAHRDTQVPYPPASLLLSYSLYSVFLSAHPPQQRALSAKSSHVLHHAALTCLASRHAGQAQTETQMQAQAHTHTHTQWGRGLGPGTPKGSLRALGAVSSRMGAALLPPVLAVILLLVRRVQAWGESQGAGAGADVHSFVAYGGQVYSSTLQDAVRSMGMGIGMDTGMGMGEVQEVQGGQGEQGGRATQGALWAASTSADCVAQALAGASASLAQLLFSAAAALDLLHDYSAAASVRAGAEAGAGAGTEGSLHACYRLALLDGVMASLPLLQLLDSALRTFHSSAADASTASAGAVGLCAECGLLSPVELAAVAALFSACSQGGSLAQAQVQSERQRALRLLQATCAAYVGMLEGQLALAETLLQGSRCGGMSGDRAGLCALRVGASCALLLPPASLLLAAVTTWAGDADMSGDGGGVEAGALYLDLVQSVSAAAMRAVQWEYRYQALARTVQGHGQGQEQGSDLVLLRPQDCDEVNMKIARLRVGGGGRAGVGGGQGGQEEGELLAMHHLAVFWVNCLAATELGGAPSPPSTAPPGGGGPTPTPGSQVLVPLSSLGLPALRLIAGTAAAHFTAASGAVLGGGGGSSGASAEDGESSSRAVVACLGLDTWRALLRVLALALGPADGLLTAAFGRDAHCSEGPAGNPEFVEWLLQSGLADHIACALVHGLLLTAPSRTSSGTAVDAARGVGGTHPLLLPAELREDLLNALQKMTIVLGTTAAAQCLLGTLFLPSSSPARGVWDCGVVGSAEGKRGLVQRLVARALAGDWKRFRSTAKTLCG